ncbi:hypothetical protein HZH66_000880 [Vespula vulgaris]|uniref:Uncharacterized protein n=1 Tax=Vespula vulgaris TaxID=7454 RepID=A0A834KPZ8_VESVU|nr:hypothetical protein HZH66_000880 [Vespula vulgaris]
MRLREDVSAVRRLWKDLEVVVKEAKEGGGTWWSRLENDMTYEVFQYPQYDDNVTSCDRNAEIIYVEFRHRSLCKIQAAESKMQWEVSRRAQRVGETCYEADSTDRKPRPSSFRSFAVSQVSVTDTGAVAAAGVRERTFICIGKDDDVRNRSSYECPNVQERTSRNPPNLGKWVKICGCMRAHLETICKRVRE